MENVEDLEVMGTLIEARMQEWEQEWLREGIEQGREQGLREGEAALLKRQLQWRFGDLPSWVAGRLQDATTEQIEQWGERLLEVDSLQALFDDQNT